MYDFHKDKTKYFEMQSEVTSDYIIPFMQKNQVIKKNMMVLEIGCAEAGVLKAFLEKGHRVVGIELMEGRAQLARNNLEKWILLGKAKILCKNIYDIDPEMDLDEKFDLIILKDVIEHIPDQERFIPFLRKFLSKDGVVMFGFPPWYMPFGGHQQICRNKWLSKIPWYHLLPISFYKRLLKWGGESIATIEGLVDIKKTGITIDRLKRILKKEKFLVIAEKYWLFNPIYKWKFGIYPKAVAQPFTRIPYLRNFYTSAFYILFK